MPHTIHPLPSSNTLLFPAGNDRFSSFIRNRENPIPPRPASFPGLEDSPFIIQKAFEFPKTNMIDFLLSFFSICYYSPGRNDLFLFCSSDFD
jgi:hypothetical protein